MTELFKRGKDKNRWFVRFTWPVRKRRSVAAGTTSEARAAVIADRVDQLLSAKKTGKAPGSDLAEWILKIKSDNPRLHGSLVGFGLIDDDETAAVVTVGGLLERFLADRRAGWKPSTLVNLGHTERNLREFFGPAKPIDSITAGDAVNFESNLRTKEDLASNTIRKRISNCKLIWTYAIDHELTAQNPFRKLASSVRGNRDRLYFVPIKTINDILEVCPDIQWKAIVALCRWGGLRCPSELAGLTWNDVDWARGRLLVRSPKTEHHEGKASRWIPLWPEIRTILADAREIAPDGQLLVCPRCSDPRVNLRTTFEKLIDRAGHKPWPKLFQNMRSSRQTELSHQHPAHVVCAWIGNSMQVAQEHYLQVTDADFEAALKPSATHVANNGISNAQQSDADGDDETKKPATRRKKVQRDAGGWALLDSNQWPPRCEHGALTN